LLAELSEGGKAMLLARPGDAGDLAEKTCRLLDDPRLGAQMVAEQRMVVERRFDSRRLVSEYAAVYGEALDRAQLGAAANP
jgi:glycosyltransferase involved in cell wall biosynthesis